MLIDRKKILIFALSILCITSVYAVDTLIHNIDAGQSSTSPWAYPSQNIWTITDGDLRFINKDNDTISFGDYIYGYYYDSAHGVFDISSTGPGIVLTSPTVWSCPSTHERYWLTGYSYNPLFGFVEFNPDYYSYVCLVIDNLDPSLSSYFWWYAYNQYFGYQSLEGIEIDSSIDIIWNHEADGRFVKVDGNTSSINNDEVITDQFIDDVRILWKFTKSKFRQDIQKNTYNFIRDIEPPTSWDMTVSGLWSAQWSSGTMRASSIKNDEILYFSPASGNVVLPAENNLIGTKTLVVEGANVYITWNIRGSWTLWIIALTVDWVGGNIYIDPSVTDIHAIMYADRSLISYDGSELDGGTDNSMLANQLYIYGSLFSENTLGGALSDTCPFYVNTGCTTNIAKKYDLNYLRRYILVQPVDPLTGNSIWPKEPQFNASSSYMWDNDNTNTILQKPWYEVYPFIVEYNPIVQSNPPPLFD